MDPENNLESNIKQYLLSFYKSSYDSTTYDEPSNVPPENRLMNLIRGILDGNNETRIGTQEFGFEKDCNEKLDSDIAAVVVSIDSPTFTRTTKHLKATVFDKLAYIGNDLSNLNLNALDIDLTFVC